MRPRVGVDGRPEKARWRRAGDQARAALILAAAAALPGCTERWAELDPRPVIANVFGAHLEGREPPPGLDGPWPKLSSVPARPTPPDPATREHISAGLAENRAQSRAPLAVTAALPRPPAAAGPPPPPRLGGVPPVRLDPLPGAVPPAAAPAALPAPPQPGAPQPGPAAAPAAPPPPPARDLLAPPPPPARDLLAPPPPPGADLLAPRRD